MNPFRVDPNPDLTAAICKVVNESTRATIRRHKAGVLTPEQRAKFIKRQEGKIAKIDQHGKLSARASQIRDTITAVSESHTRAQLEKLSTTRLRELKKKYEALVLKGNKDASRELADIRGILRSKGAGHALDEASACETAALARLKAANAEDLKDTGGAAGEKAHKRLHRTIGKILKDK